MPSFILSPACCQGRGPADPQNGADPQQETWTCQPGRGDDKGQREGHDGNQVTGHGTSIGASRIQREPVR